MPRFAAIDVGSNAIRMRIVDATAPLGAGDGQLALLANESEPVMREVMSQRAPVRLGTEVFLTGKLTPSSIAQACAALREFKVAMDAAGVSAYRATATSAVREAQNGATLAERARREAGVDLEIIEGVEEARLIQLAVVKKLGLSEKSAVLIDVATDQPALDGQQGARAQPGFEGRQGIGEASPSGLFAGGNIDYGLHRNF